MKVLILGSDGYLGHSLTIHLLKKGHKVYGADNRSRRKRVIETGGDSLTPIASLDNRSKYLENKFDNFRGTSNIYLGKDPFLSVVGLLDICTPDAIVHLAEMPSAPWSMIDCDHTVETQTENVMGTMQLLWAMREVCPEAHLLKLGTMGEYGTPNCDIPEGKIPEGCLGGRVEMFRDSEKFHCYRLPTCPMRNLLFPRTAGSFYHLSKVHDTFNIEFCCRVWNLRSTDVMQGVVFGLNEVEDPIEITRFDYDQYFGTVINRFCAQSLISHPLTIFGKGGQIRGYLPLKDSLQCMTLALENPPEKGEYRTLNQFEKTYSVNQLSQVVTEAAMELGLSVDPGPIVNPRVEAEEHYYNPAHQKLFDFGYVPTTDIKGEIRELIHRILPYKDRIIKDVIMPTTTWR